MKQSIWKGPLSLLVLILLLFCTVLAGCRTPSGAGDVHTSEAEQTSEEETSGEKSGDALDLRAAAYTVVRGEEAGSYPTALAVELNKQLSAEGLDTTIKSDWLRPGEAVDDEAFEILVGETNRAASARAKEEVAGTYDYLIRVDGNKIVIVGGSDYALSYACTQFLAHCAENDYRLSPELLLEGSVELSPYLLGVTNQAASAVEVYDIGTGRLDEHSLIWSHTYSAYNIAGVKLRRYKGEEVVLAAFGATSANMVSLSDKATLWSTDETAQNPHSVELIPFANDDYLVAVAASTGAEIRFFDPADASGKPIATVSYADAHGVLWDPLSGCLWAWGTNLLTAYRVEKSESTVQVTEIAVYTAPTGGGHDLAPFYGDTNSLLLSTGTRVYRFDKSEKVFYETFDGSSALQSSGVKGVGNFPDGSVVCIYPDGAFKSWTSKSIIFGRRSGSAFARTTLASETGHFYKVRVWCADYQ